MVSIKPPNFAAIDPLAVALLTVLVDIDPFAVLLASNPLADKTPAIGPHELPEAVLFLIIIRAYVPATIWPEETALAVDLIILPFAFVLPLVSPLIHPFSVQVVLKEFSVVGALILPLEVAQTMFLALEVVPLEG